MKLTRSNMKLIARTLHSVAMTYCHYIAMRMEFRAKTLARAAESSKLLAKPCPNKPSEGCC